MAILGLGQIEAARKIKMNKKHQASLVARKKATQKEQEVHAHELQVVEEAMQKL